MTVFYKKVGRRYKPVSEYDNELMSAFPKGAHIVLTYPGGRSTRYNIDPAWGPMIAAGRYAEENISKVLMQASDLRPKRRPITEGQRSAWENLVKEFGEEARYLEWPSAREATEAGVDAMTKEADKLLTNSAVRAAWDDFMLLCKLTMEKQNGS
jgi:hypothetical protein